MKTVFLSIALLFAVSLSAQQTDKYTQTMITNLAKIDSAKTTTQKQELSNTFERIAKAEKATWQPFYYVAMLQILHTYQLQAYEVKHID